MTETERLAAITTEAATATASSLDLAVIALAEHEARMHVYEGHPVTDGETDFARCLAVVRHNAALHAAARRVR